MSSKTQIVFVMDRSGSMATYAKDAVGGFNSFLEDQRRLENVKFSLLQFDTDFIWTYREMDPKECRPLVLGESYQPRGGTALYDAVGLAIKELGMVEKAIIVVYTDGDENSSRTYNHSQIREELSRVKNRGWEVLFLSSDMKAVESIKRVYSDWSKIAYAPKYEESVSLTGFGSTVRAYNVSGLSGTRGMSLQNEVDEVINNEKQKSDTVVSGGTLGNN